MNQLVTYLFILSLALIALVYYVGLKSDATSVGGVVGNWGQIFTGRSTSTNAFAQYPTTPQAG